MLKVCEVGSDFDNKIEDFLLNSSSATFYHLPKWLKVLERESNQKGVKLICVDDNDKIVGYMPLLHTRGLPAGIGGVLASRRLSSLPRTPVAGPISEDLLVIKKMIQYAIDSISNEKNVTLQIKATRDTYKNLIDNLQCLTWREDYYKEIPPSPQKITFSTSKVEKELYRSLNRAKEKGIRSRYGNSLDDLKKWYRLYLETMHFHATPARSFDFFESLWNEFNADNRMSLNLIEQSRGKKSEILTGSITFKFKDTIYGAFKGSNRKKMKYAVNDLLHYFEFSRAQKEGYRIFDMGEVQKNHLGLEHYKQKWGMKSYRLYHYYTPSHKELQEESLDPGNAGNLKKKLWHIVPLKITQSIGKSFYKRL
jgi:Acetyltransferase (GNAT) domain